MPNFLRANKIQICYQDLGNAGAPAILLIAGLGEQMYEWPTEFCNLFVQQGYRLIRFDSRDIGLSSKMELEYSLNDMADDALGILNALEIDQAHVVGMSMGGMIAQIFSATYPARTTSLCSLMSSSGRLGLPGPTPEVQAMLVKKTDGSRESFIDNWVAGKLLIDSPAHPANKDDLIARAQANCQRSYHPVGYLRHLNAIYANGSREQLLKTITCPTLVLHGTADPLIPHECGLDTAKLIAGAKIELIDGMGHNLPAGLFERLSGLILTNIKSAV